MTILFRLVLAVNASFFILAGLYEWTFYVSPAYSSHLLLPDSSVAPATRHPGVFNYLRLFGPTSGIPGDARNTRLRRAAVIVFAYNRYASSFPCSLQEQLPTMSACK